MFSQNRPVLRRTCGRSGQPSITHWRAVLLSGPRTVSATIAAILSKNPPPPHTGGEVADLVLAMLRKDPANRPNAASIAAVLERAADVGRPARHRLPDPEGARDGAARQPREADRPRPGPDDARQTRPALTFAPLTEIPVLDAARIVNDLPAPRAAAALLALGETKAARIINICEDPVAGMLLNTIAADNPSLVGRILEMVTARASRPPPRQYELSRFGVCSIPAALHRSNTPTCPRRRRDRSRHPVGDESPERRGPRHGDGHRARCETSLPRAPASVANILQFQEHHVTVERLAKGRAFHATVQTAFLTDLVDATGFRERGWRLMTGGRGRVDLAVVTDDREKMLIIIEIKGTDWDKIRADRVKRNVQRHIRQLLAYLDTAIGELEVGQWEGVAGALLYPSRPASAESLACIEEAAAEQAIMVTWYDEVSWRL